MSMMAKRNKEIIEEITERNNSEVERYKAEIERLRTKQRNYDSKNLQLNDEANEARMEAEGLKMKILELKERVRHKDEVILKNKLEKDRMNNSVEYESNHGDLIKAPKYSDQ